MRSLLCLLIFVLLLFSPARAGFFLVAEFVWYNNSLESYPDVPQDSETCCFSQRNCTEDCVTRLRYCFKEYNAVTNISDDDLSGMACMNTLTRSTLSKPVEYIDYSQPPLDMKRNNPIPATMSYRGFHEWPGKLQLFVRASVGDHIVEYFQLDFELGLNDPPLNRTINGSFYGSHMTFTFGLSLTCLAHFYGPNCSVFCRPVDSNDQGHYRCLSDGSKQCLPGYQNTSNNCLTCVPADGCHEDQGYCEGPGECICKEGYTGENCEVWDVCGSLNPCESSEQCVNNGTGAQPYTCTPRPSPSIALTSGTPSSTSDPAPSEPATSEPATSSVVIAGVVAGSALLLITLSVLAILVILALRRRLHNQTVDLKGGRDEKLPNKESYSRESGLGGLMDNPMYEVSMKGTHLPLGKSPSLELEVEYDVDNPLYTLGDTPGNGAITGHDYDYATANDVQPSSFVPPLSSEFEMYAEPDIGHSLPLPSSPYSHPRTHHYHEPAPTPPPRPGPIYDDPLSLPEIKEATPANLENHYETAEDVLEAANDPQHTIYDSDKDN